ncbi:MAG: heme-binding protein [Actinobacteria bacterium]|nr:heme-binding protein [Actinomycetota bacterium]
MKVIRTIVLEDAKKAVAGMEQKCLELKLECSFCVTDCMGNIVILQKMDNASPASLELAVVKAKSALSSFLSTRKLDDINKDKNIQIGYLPDNCRTAI